MLTQAIRDLVFKRDWRTLDRLLDCTDRVRRAKALEIVSAHVPLTINSDGKPKWIKDKSRMDALRLPDIVLLNDLQKSGLCTRLAQALRPLGIPASNTDNLAMRLRRLLSDAAVTADFGEDEKLAGLFIKFCQSNAVLINRKPSQEKKASPFRNGHEFCLDSSEQSVSVRTISGGAPDSNRRKH